METQKIFGREIQIGDQIQVRIKNEKGDRNLDGTWLSGTVAKLCPQHDMVMLDNGWYCHGKDQLMDWKRPEKGASDAPR